jgi:hypothetical protein
VIQFFRWPVACYLLLAARGYNRLVAIRPGLLALCTKSLGAITLCAISQSADSFAESAVHSRTNLLHDSAAVLQGSGHESIRIPTNV